MRPVSKPTADAKRGRVWERTRASLSGERKEEGERAGIASEESTRILSGMLSAVESLGPSVSGRVAYSRHHHQHMHRHQYIHPHPYQHQQHQQPQQGAHHQHPPHPMLPPGMGLGQLPLPGTVGLSPLLGAPTMAHTMTPVANEFARPFPKQRFEDNRGFGMPTSLATERRLKYGDSPPNGPGPHHSPRPPSATPSPPQTGPVNLAVGSNGRASRSPVDDIGGGRGGYPEQLLRGQSSPTQDVLGSQISPGSLHAQSRALHEQQQQQQTAHQRQQHQEQQQLQNQHQLLCNEFLEAQQQAQQQHQSVSPPQSKDPLGNEFSKLYTAPAPRMSFFPSALDVLGAVGGYPPLNYDLYPYSRVLGRPTYLPNQRPLEPAAYAGAPGDNGQFLPPPPPPPPPPTQQQQQQQVVATSHAGNLSPNDGVGGSMLLPPSKPTATKAAPVMTLPSPPGSGPLHPTQQPMQNTVEALMATYNALATNAAQAHHYRQQAHRFPGGLPDGMVVVDCERPVPPDRYPLVELAAMGEKQPRTAPKPSSSSTASETIVNDTLTMERSKRSGSISAPHRGGLGHMDHSHGQAHSATLAPPQLGMSSPEQYTAAAYHDRMVHSGRQPVVETASFSVPTNLSVNAGAVAGSDAAGRKGGQMSPATAGYVYVQQQLQKQKLLQQQQLQQQQQQQHQQQQQQQQQQQEFKVPCGKEGPMRHRVFVSRTSPGESPRTAPNGPADLVGAPEPHYIDPPFTFSFENEGSPCLTLQLTDPIPVEDPERNSSFIGGAMVEFDNGERKRIEDIRAEDLISTAERSSDLRMTEAVTCAITPRFVPNGPEHLIGPNLALLLVSFSYDNEQLQSEIETSIEYPFFVTNKGWASFDPERTYRMYNLRCTQLQVGDVFLALLPRNTPPPPSPMVRCDVPPDGEAENGTVDSDTELDPGGSEYPTPSELANAANHQRQLRSPEPEPPIVSRQQQEQKKARKSRPSKQKQPAGPPIPRTLPPPPPLPKPTNPYQHPTVRRQHKPEAFITIEDDEPPMHVVTKKGDGGMRMNPSSPRPVTGHDGNNWESAGKRRQEHQLRRPIAKRKPTPTEVDHQQQPQPTHPAFLDVGGREPRTLNIYQCPTTKLCPSQQQQQPQFSTHATTSNGHHGQMARTNGDTYSDSE